MLDINLIRGKPAWIKEQIAKLNDPSALERIDVILKLDQQRRSLLTQSEAIQAQRNRLNKGMGRLRGDKTLDDSERARRAYFVTAALEAGDYQKAAAIMDGQGELDALPAGVDTAAALDKDRKSTRLNSSHVKISYAGFCLKKKKQP